MTAVEGRRDLFQLLDAVEQGEDVVLERGGVRFRLTMDRPRPGHEPPPSPLAAIDPDVLEGNWTWTADENGHLKFSPR